MLIVFIMLFFITGPVGSTIYGQVIGWSPGIIVGLTTVFNALLVLAWTGVIGLIIHTARVNRFIKSKTRNYNLSTILVRPSVELFLMSFALGSVIPIVIYHLIGRNNRTDQLIMIIFGSTLNCLINVAYVLVSFVFLPIYLALSVVIVMYFLTRYIIGKLVKRWKRVNL